MSDLDKMHKEFPEIYDELYKSGNSQFFNQLKMRKNAIKESLKEKEKPADKLTMLFQKAANDDDPDDDSDLLA